MHEKSLKRSNVISVRYHLHEKEPYTETSILCINIFYSNKMYLKLAIISYILTIKLLHVSIYKCVCMPAELYKFI